MENTLSASGRESQEPVLRTGRGQGRGPFGPFRIFGTIESESGPNRHDQAFAGAVIRFLRFLLIINILLRIAINPTRPLTRSHAEAGSGMADLSPPSKSR